MISLDFYKPYSCYLLAGEYIELKLKFPPTLKNCMSHGVKEDITRVRYSLIMNLPSRINRELEETPPISITPPTAVNRCLNVEISWDKKEQQILQNDGVRCSRV